MTIKFIVATSALALAASTLAFAARAADTSKPETPAATQPPAMVHGMHGRTGQAGPVIEQSPDGAFHRSFNDAEKWVAEFDDPERDAWQKPEAILDALHLDPAARVADLGAGTGYFAVKIAKRVPNGKVLAADIEPDMVKYLGERARREHLNNVTPVLAGLDSANLPEAVDVVMVVDTYHHIGYRPQYFAKLKASLRSKGRLVIVDFRPDSPIGPPHRIPAEQITEELKAAGYALVQSHEFLPRQYFLVYQERG
jgi:SAM-dependent methyltransferase